MERPNQTEMNLALIRCLVDGSKTMQVLIEALDHDKHPELADSAHASMKTYIQALDKCMKLLEKSLP